MYGVILGTVIDVRHLQYRNGYNSTSGQTPQYWLPVFLDEVIINSFLVSLKETRIQNPFLCHYEIIEIGCLPPISSDY